ncbi:MAG TPA: Ig-like domain-containing protein, partial [Halalkalibaculum sp.]|nr:Ig-like domain-containing protein [Halalkalibaculum sp.]
YTADADASGSDEFTVQGLSDFSGLPAYLYRVQLDIQENGSPVFTSVINEETLTEGEEFGFQFEAEDPDGDELTFTLTAGGDVANASLTADGLFSFAPEAGQAGEYPFTVQVSDGVLTDEHEFTIEVEPPNQPPLFTTTFDEQTIREGEEFSFQFEAEDSNGDTLVFNLTEGEDVENVSFSEEGLFTFVPDFEQAGEYGFMVEVDDGELFTEHSFFIIVEEGNRPPEALSIMASTRINIPVTIDLTEYISDPDGDPLTIVNVSVPQYGQAFFDDNLVTYTPARNFSGTDDFQYTVSDGRGETAAGMVTIEVLGLSFKITELNLPDNVVSRAFDISDNGHVTGMINEGSGSAFLWVDEELSIISGLNQVFGVNDSGNLAGIAEEGGTALPAIYLNGNLVKGSTMGGDFAALYDINNSNTGVGVANDASGTLTGFLWNEKGQQPIAIDDGDLQLYSINNAGVMAGFLQVNNQQGQAVRVLPDGSIQLLSSGSGNSSRAFGAGNGGQIVGVIESGATIRGAVWQNGSVQELPGLGGSTTIAYDVNNSGVVVGSSGTASQKWISNRDIISQITGFVSDKNYKAKETTSSSFEFDNTASLVQNEGLRAALWLGNELTDLNDLIPSDSGWELIEARAINNHMNIVGFGLLNGEVRAFLLTPAEVEDPVAGISVQQVTGGKEAVVDLWRQVENTYGRATVTEIWGASHGAAELRQERYLHYTAGMNIVATADTVHYQVADQRGAVAEGEVVFVLGELSESFELSQNYPNPFNSSTVIPFKLAETGRVVVELYSINGRKIAVLMDQVLQRGTHRTDLGNLNLSSGVYFYRLRVTNASGKPVFTETRKMSLVK